MSVPPAFPSLSGIRFRSYNGASDVLSMLAVHAACRARDQSDPDLSVVAWDGTQVAGAYLCRRAENVGEISQVAVGLRWRGRGIARALAMQSLHNLRASGCVTARLFTSTAPDDPEPTDGPQAMYRKFGFYPIARHLRFRKPMLPR